MIARCALFGLLAWVFAPAGLVHAFSDPQLFGQTTLAAGGGGRYFTGSPAPTEGYTCKVCHEGGPETKLDVVGLPLAGYQPGARYEIVVSWPSHAKKFALALELTDQRGKPAGTVRLPPEGEIQAPEFCEPASDMILAASISDAPNGRQVINMPDCGAKRLRMLWIAPAKDVGPVWFSGSAVTSDGQGDAYHDGVTDFGRVIASNAVASVTTASCSLQRAGASGASAGWQLGVLCALALFVRRRRSLGSVER